MTAPSNSYTNIFGGTPVQPSETSYLAYTLSVQTTQLSWPIQFQNTNDVTAAIMNVKSLGIDGRYLVLPDSTFVGNGTTLLIINTGAHSFNVLDFNEDLISAVPASASYMFILTDNTTSAGTWILSPFGAGTLAVTSVAATAPAQGFTITGSPITTSGNLVFTLNDDLAAVEGLNTTGIALRTADSTWTTGELTTANTNLTITNPDGVSGNPLLTVGPNLTGLDSVVTGTFTGGNIGISANTISSVVAGITLAPLVNTNLALTTTGTGNISLNGITVDSSGNLSGLTNLTLNTLTSNTIQTSGGTPLLLTGNTLSSTANGSNINIVPHGGGTVDAAGIYLGGTSGVFVESTGIANTITNLNSISFAGAAIGFSDAVNYSLTFATAGISVNPPLNGDFDVKTTGTGAISLKNIIIDNANNVTGVSNLTVNGKITNPQVAKAFVAASWNGSIVNILYSYNVTSVVGFNGAFTVTFTNPIANMCPVISPLSGSVIIIASIGTINPPNSLLARCFGYGGGTFSPLVAGTFYLIVL